MKKLSIYILGAALVGLTFTACEEEDGLFGDNSAESRLGEQQLLAESVGSTIFNVVDRLLRDPNFNSGDTVTIDNAQAVRQADTVRVLYGNGVVGADGTVTKGTLRVEVSGNYITPGSLANVSLLNYKRDGDQVQGSLAINNKSLGNIDLTITNFSVNNEFVFSASKNIIWTSGYSTFTDFSDDKYAMLGTASLSETNSNNAISSSIKDTLRYDRACQYGITQGIIDLAVSGDSTSFDTGSIDFITSDGCNNTVTITLTDTATGKQVVTPTQFSGF